MASTLTYQEAPVSRYGTVQRSRENRPWEMRTDPGDCPNRTKAVREIVERIKARQGKKREEQRPEASA